MDASRSAQIIARSADPQRAVQHLEWLRQSGPVADAIFAKLTIEGARALTAVLAGSRVLTGWLVRHPEWLDIFLDAEGLTRPRRREGLQAEIDAWLGPALARGDTAEIPERLHLFRQRELIRIAARDLARLGTLPEIVLEISNAADAFLDGLLRWVWQQQVERFGTPWHKDADDRWQPATFCVLGLGKHGGQELNYSSDVDLLFVYSGEGATFKAPPKPRQTTGQLQPNHQFFKRLCETLIREATTRGVESGALRVDLRLRPEGDAGPLARSLESYENFYAEWGQTWERMMLLKARRVAGDETLGGEFIEAIESFRHPRAIGEGLLREMAEMKARTEREIVGAGELDRNVKLGRGGIREIEFVVQTLQVLNGGKFPFVQSPQTLGGLPRLAAYEFLDSGDAAALATAYPFLRDVEHRLQMDEHRQTHTIPDDPAVVARLAKQMGFPDPAAFRAALGKHTATVRAVYDRVLGRATPPAAAPDRLPGDFQSCAGAWRELLASHRFRDPDKGVRLLRQLVEGPGFVHVSRRTTELGRQLIPRLLELCPPAGPDAEFVLSDPDRVLARLDSYIQAYGARASLYELWNSRPAVFEHILKLFDRSEFLAELAIRTPDLVDDLEIGGHLRRQKDAATTLEDLRHGAADADQHLWLRRYFQTEFMRLGLRDILGYVEFADANAELTALAEACVRYAVEVVARRHRLRRPPFAVIALGKFGGRELVYGSDLDLIFVAPNATKNLARLQKLAGEVIDLLATRTDQGAVFVLDARLRPDGEKGLLVNSLKAHEEYYRQRAMLWEIQALTRARAVAGDARTGSAFEALAARLTRFASPSLPLSAFTPDWKREIANMRRRIERERTPAGREALAFKTGAGGLVDVDFVAQALAMEHGWFEPNTQLSLESARAAGVLPPEEADLLIDRFRRLRRMESILRRWSFEGEAELPDDPAPQYRVAVRCGYAEAAPFLEDVARWRADVRRIYEQVFVP